MFKYSDIDLVPESFYSDIINTKVDEDTSPIVTLSKAEYTTEIDGKKYSIKIDLNSQIKKIMGKQKNELGNYQESPYKEAFLPDARSVLFYDPFEAVEKYSLYRSDKNKNFEVNESGHRKAQYIPQILTVRQAKQRIGIFFKICKLCATEKVLETIIRKAKKNKDGSFDMRSVVRISSMMCSNSDSLDIGQEFYTLYAKVEQRDQLKIGLKKVTVSATAETWIFGPKDFQTDGFTKRVGGIYQTTDDLTTCEQNIFGIPVDYQKYSIKKNYDKKLPITCNGITVNTPVVLLDDGQLAFALPKPVPFAEYEGLLVEKDGGYIIETKDHSLTTQTQIGKYTMDVELDGTLEIEMAMETMEMMNAIEQYCNSAEKLSPTYSIEKLENSLPEEFQRNFYEYRDLIRDESLIAVGVSCLLNGILDIRDMVKYTDLIAVTHEAKLKKNGTFNRTKVQHLLFRSRPGTIYFFSCYAQKDCLYCIHLGAYPRLNKISLLVDELNELEYDPNEIILPGYASNEKELRKCKFFGYNNSVI